MKLGDITQPIVQLLDDAHSAEQLLLEHDEPFYRRSYIRSTMAAAEAVVWFLKQVCLRAAKERGRGLSIGEIALLSDRTFELKSNGRIRSHPKYLKLPDNIRFTISTCNRMFATEADVGAGGMGWNSFLAAIEIRNRLAHPKQAADLNVSDEELETCKSSSAWFNQLIASFVTALVHRNTNDSKDGGA